VLLRFVSHLQDLRPNSFNTAGLNHDWNLQLFLNMKKREISLDKLHFVYKFTKAFQLIISLYICGWRHLNCLSPAVAWLHKTSICTNTDIHKEREIALHYKQMIHIIREALWTDSLQLPLHIKLCFTEQFWEFVTKISSMRNIVMGLK
jgi:hypothetical protein